MSDQALMRHALSLLKACPEYVSDAQRFAPIGNSVVGSLMSLTLGAPRWATEPAVCEALRELTREKTRKRKKKEKSA
jgi:hypothetical protein